MFSDGSVQGKKGRVPVLTTGSVDFPAQNRSAVRVYTLPNRAELSSAPCAYVEVLAASEWARLSARGGSLTGCKIDGSHVFVPHLSSGLAVNMTSDTP